MCVRVYIRMYGHAHLFSYARTYLVVCIRLSARACLRLACVCVCVGIYMWFYKSESILTV